MDRSRRPHRALLRLAATAGLALCAALGAAGCGEAPAPRPAGPLLVIDVKLGQPFEMRTLLGATLLLDGEEIARFQNPRPEATVVFSRRLEGIAPGEHEVAVRLDAQVASPTPTEYAAVGLATWGGSQLPLIDRAGPLADGEAFRWRLALPAPGEATPAPASPGTAPSPAAGSAPGDAVEGTPATAEPAPTPSPAAGLS